MAKALLVNVDVEKGAEILRSLDKAGLGVRVALWAYLPEYEDWRLILSSPRLDAAELRDAYGLVHAALDAAGIQLDATQSLMILNRKDPFVRHLRRWFAKARNVEGMRLGGQVIGDRFVEDAYVYRVR